MRLSRIKLAGFKSFVDPTTIAFPSNLVGVVGPNGCGKSNVIDAIRWVMGETSAKHLRGDSMADVIFNGSAGRKPVGSATIELFFDNADGSVGGQYANYSEIAIRRTVARDGTSQYFLNGTRCRRKDITGIFLGTGLGPRSYAIIEQGMVSRLIEAKPEDTRVYIEEAAGISKYKERRRETENRIRHTRDNLDRLNDLREEVDKQIQHLQRQARQAERYQELKKDQRRLEAELLAIRLATQKKQVERRAAELAEEQTRFDSVLADQRRREANIEACRERHTEATEAFNKTQADYYAVQSEISRLEQAIEHAREIRERQEADLQDTKSQLSALRSEIDKDAAQLAQLEASLEKLMPDLEQARSLEESSGANLQRIEEALDAWQASWHEFNLEAKEYQQASQVERTRIEHLEFQIEKLTAQGAELEAEGQGIVLGEFEEALASVDRDEQAARQRVCELEQALHECETTIRLLRDREQSLSEQLESTRGELESRRGRVETLEALQAEEFGADDSAVQQWLSRAGLSDEPRLAQRLVVEPRWERAVETVLGDFLQAVSTRRPEEHMRDLPAAGNLVLINCDGDAGRDIRNTLASKVDKAGSAAELLSTVLVADSLEQAFSLRARLLPGQSVITADGLWLGRGWVRVSRRTQESGGVISREQAIRALRDEVRDLEQNLRLLESQRDETRREHEKLASERSRVSIELQESNRTLAEAGAQLGNRRQDLDRARNRLHALGRDRESVRKELAELNQAVADSRSRLSHALEATERLDDRRPTLQRQQEELLEEYNRAREQAEHDRDAVSQIKIEYESRRATRESASTTLERVQTQRRTLEERIAGLNNQLESGREPTDALQASLQGQLERASAVEHELAARRTALGERDQELRAEESARADCEQRVAAAREVVDELRINAREAEVRLEGLNDQFLATGQALEETLARLDETADADEWQAQLDRVTRRIERLGAINLAAIDEFNEQSERKEYLDAQFGDLTSALETLERAIRKIDKETRARFKDTFDKVNAGLQKNFPRLFGGGHAYLELTDDDLLSAGVSVMARPPGKRNSHIHLLSGGEKALTAVALIFSIFELNPAPFCLLDEVDAPLDDANVGRFCDIVREMSSSVQFIVITHNKTTMEMARQLTGVTMNEPGVSRLVSVDIDEAVQLAAS
jgi:chromosome segregation protein